MTRPTIEAIADAILATHGGVATTAAIAAMQRAIEDWLEAGARTDLVAGERDARRLLMQALDRAQAARGIG
jgi:hypothetical protein